MSQEEEEHFLGAASSPAKRRGKSRARFAKLRVGVLEGLVGERRAEHVMEQLASSSSPKKEVSTANLEHGFHDFHSLLASCA